MVHSFKFKSRKIQLERSTKKMAEFLKRKLSKMCAFNYDRAYYESCELCFFKFTWFYYILYYFTIKVKGRRPNLGCRELIRLNASKILPGILNDIGDWVEATRIKSIELLYIMIWQAEANITQHLETVLQTLFKASHEKIDKIQSNIFKCSKLVGHFTDSNVTLNLAFKTIKKMQSPNKGSINILNGLLIGHDPARIASNILIETLEFLNEISLTVDVSWNKM